MDETSTATAYICPMHSQVRQSTPGKCPTCGMPLVPEGARFALLRHMLGKPVHLALMAAGMIALMAAAMMLLR
jgi:Heavy metal binding domain